MRKELKRIIYRLSPFGYKECAECKNFEKCIDRKPFLHRDKKGCNYGKIHGA